MMTPALNKRSPFLVAAVLGAAALSSCFGGGGSSSSPETAAGNFEVETINVSNGDVWALNRPIVIKFNHSVNVNTVSFSTVQIRPVSPEVQGQPVTGTFEMVAGTQNTTVLFRPACPTNSDNDNGAFVPGGYTYQVNIPTAGSSGGTVLRDVAGHTLLTGLTRTFVTPTAPTEPLFIDTVPGPPLVQSVTFPDGLNLFSHPDPTIEVRFNQSIDGRSSNLNLSNLFVVYSDGEEGAPGGNTYCGLTTPNSSCTNRVPGQLFVVQNCGQTGAQVFFQVTGVLPPNRNLRLVVLSTFKDIVGETGTQNQVSTAHLTSRLSDVYTNDGIPDPSWDDSDLATDEFLDAFDTTRRIDPNAALQLPPAEVQNGFATASFDFPGSFVPSDTNLFLTGNTYLEVDTNTQVVITDSNNKSFTVDSGVLTVHDLTIEAGSTIRARGRNPFIIYATGTVTINGTLDSSGNDSHWPTGLNSPQFPEGGAAGECGGGNGGTASIVTTAETLRGQAGWAPFDPSSPGGSGGGGGEGCFQQGDGIGAIGAAISIRHIIAAGGGGGSFALTPNEAIVWDRWSGEANPDNFDNSGPDHDEEDHEFYDDVKSGGIQGDPRHPIRGGEPGMRGTSFNCDEVTRTAQNDPTRPHGAHGMEDNQQDDIREDMPGPNPLAFDGNLDNGPNWDPPTTWTPDPGFGNQMVSNFQFGHPTRGPDPGLQGGSIFSGNGDTGNDFWGRRLNADGTVTVGELLTPWAGSGGGAGGDSQLVRRSDLNMDATIDEDPSLFFPSVPFPNGGTSQRYRKGAPGGGGGGQLLVMAVGFIILGEEAEILVRGGIGHGGESVIYTYNQVSGSGGGSGGHAVLHSASGFDISAFNIGTMTTAADVQTFLDDPEQHPYSLQAIGGRRGWVASRLTNVGGAPGGRDGNPDFMLGRGGAGGNGVIQIHVPNPKEDIEWPSDAKPGIVQYIDQNGGVDGVEAVLAAFSAPNAYVLIPFFASGSQIQSRWIDTGLAYKRNADQPLPRPYPDYAHPTLLHFAGTETDGSVMTAGDMVQPIAPVLVTTGVFPSSAFEMVVPSASLVFNIQVDEFKAQFLRNPQLLIGYDLVSDPSDVSGFQIVEAQYSRAADTLTLMTLSSDGPMTFATGVNWSIRQKFFSISTTGTKDRLPQTAAVIVEFQGTNEVAPGTNAPNPNAIVPGPTTWTADLGELEGLRFVRYRVTFEIDALDGGVSLSSERPGLDFFKWPFIF